MEKDSESHTWIVVKKNDELVDRQAARQTDVQAGREQKTDEDKESRLARHRETMLQIRLGSTWDKKTQSQEPAETGCQDMTIQEFTRNVGDLFTRSPNDR